MKIGLWERFEKGHKIGIGNKYRRKKRKNIWVKICGQKIEIGENSIE